MFRKPTAHIVCEVRLPLAYCSAHNSVLCALFCAMLEDSLKSLSYYAEMAQLKFQITNTDNGLLLILSGFSHKLPALLMAVLEALEGSVRSDGPLVWPRFEALREALMRRYQNFDLTVDAFRRAQYYETLPVQTPRWTQAEYLDELRSITAATLKAFLPQLLSQVYFRALLCGNIAQPWKVRWRQQLSGFFFFNFMHRLWTACASSSLDPAKHCPCLVCKTAACAAWSSSPKGTWGVFVVGVLSPTRPLAKLFLIALLDRPRMQTTPCASPSKLVGNPFSHRAF